MRGFRFGKMFVKRLFVCTLVMFFIGMFVCHRIMVLSSVTRRREVNIYNDEYIDEKQKVNSKLTEEFVDQPFSPFNSFDRNDVNISESEMSFDKKQLLVQKNDFKSKSACSKVPVSEKLNCLPMTKFLTERLCLSVGCCWEQTGLSDPERNVNSVIPLCYFPSDHVGYEVHDVKYKTSGIEATFERQNPSGLPKDIPKLKFIASYIETNVLRIMIKDFNASRYEVPLPLSIDTSGVDYKSLNYDISLSKNGLLEVTRKRPQNTVFSVSLAKLLFSDQLLQLTSNLPSHYVYGLADHMGSFLKSTNWTKYTFFNSDTIPEVNKNLYSSFPFYLVMEEQGNSHGVFFFNSNAMDIILQPKPAVTFRAIGGIFDFFIFLGPSPSAVVQDYTKLVGYPAMPPYWSLGFHLCRLGYMSLNKTMEVCKRTIEAGIPYDTQWNDIDYMDSFKDFTYDKNNFNLLPNFVRMLNRLGMHYVLITDPAISNAEAPGSYPPYDDGIAMDIFVKNRSGQILTTKVWNKISSVFPDFTNPLSISYWYKQMALFHSKVPFDGVWLDMNEPTNFLNGSFYGCPSVSSLEHPVYVPGEVPLSTKTICMTAEHHVSSHYNVHNIYGIMQTKATYRAMSYIRRKRPFILTRAGFPGIGKYSAMWNGDVISEWDHMRASIPSMLGLSINGVPMSGSDICGFNGDTTVELCARWTALGAFYPFSRNHNSDENIEQDPVALGEPVITTARLSLSVRYALLPYLYTLFYFSHINGDTVARPLFFEFPHDVQSLKIDQQFLWGPALLITPVLEPDATGVMGYFPPGIWYNFFTRNKIVSEGKKLYLSLLIHEIGLYIRGGYILPCQIPNVTTTLSRKNGFFIIVAFSNKSEASGALFWDDGNSLDVIKTGKYNFITFRAIGNNLTSEVIHYGYPTVMDVVSVQISGVERIPTQVFVNTDLSPFEYNPENELLLLENLSISLLEPIAIVWE